MNFHKLFSSPSININIFIHVHVFFVVIVVLGIAVNYIVNDRYKERCGRKEKIKSGKRTKVLGCPGS